MIRCIKPLALFMLSALTSTGFVTAQNIYDISIYHGAGDPIMWDKDKKEFISDLPIIKRKGETVNIKIVNPNPLFYTYELKENEVETKSEFPDISSLVGVLNKFLSAAEGVSDAVAYRNMITTLEAEIVKAKGILEDSDLPEPLTDAKDDKRTGGLKLAIDKMNKNEILPFTEGHFNSPNLAEDLKKALGQIEDLDPFIKDAFTALNAAYVQKVNEIKTLVSPQNLKEEITKTFTITEKTTKIVLIIKQKDPAKKGLKRITKEVTIATVRSFYERTTLELIPIANVRFAGNVSEFYLENGMVKQRFKDDVSIVPGVMLNVNFVNFGETKEMAVGLGLGYIISTKENQINQFALSSLFSYKNFLRIGLGVGFSSYPGGLKDGGKVDAPLPGEIKNLKDIISYDRKAGFFIVFSFTGLNLKL